MKTKGSAKSKRTRNSLAKSIAKETTIGRKWSMAIGQSLFDKFPPDSELELQSILTKWRILKMMKTGDEATNPLRDPMIVFVGEKLSLTRQGMLEEFASLGYKVATAIMDGQHRFFSRLAAKVQFDRWPNDKWSNDHKIYAAILEFCYWSSSGTAKRPCDLRLLYNHLMKRGYTFGDDLIDQIPRTLRKTCSKLGVVCLKSKGRKFNDSRQRLPRRD